MGMIFQPLLSTSDGVLTVTHLTFRSAVYVLLKKRIFQFLKDIELNLRTQNNIYSTPKWLKI